MQRHVTDGLHLYPPLDDAAAGRLDLAKIERRRAQSRTRQLRYLQKKRQYEHDLTLSVATMQSEVRSMQLQLRQLQNADLHPLSAAAALPASTPASFLQTARDLVHCFRSGFSPRRRQPWLPCASLTQEQIRFVHRHLHPNVQHGELRGQNSFLEEWQRCTSSFSSLQLHGHSFELLTDSPTGHAICRTELTLALGLSAATFERVFPHLLQPQHSVLLSRLLGQQIHTPMTLQLQFDAQGLVVGYNASLDFVQALRPLLSSYEDVATVLHRAHISSFGHIGLPTCRSSCSRDARLALSFLLSPSDAAQ
jgi:hypothetical protein